MEARARYSFGPFILDATRRELLKDGAPVHLTPKELDLLNLLVENAGRVVEKSEILERVWHGAFVEEGNITQTVSVLRKTIESAPGMGGAIRTVARHGYRFDSPVTALPASPARRRASWMKPIIILPILTAAVAGYVAFDIARISPPPPHLHTLLLLPVVDRTAGATAQEPCQFLLNALQQAAIKVEPLTVLLGQEKVLPSALTPGEAARTKKADASRAASLETRVKFLHAKVGLWRARRSYPEWSFEYEFLPEDSSTAAAYIGEQVRAQLLLLTRR